MSKISITLAATALAATMVAAPAHAAGMKCDDLPGKITTCVGDGGDVSGGHVVVGGVKNWTKANMAGHLVILKKGAGTVKRCGTRTVRPDHVVTCKYTAARHGQFKAVFVRRDGVRVDSPWMYL